MMADVFDENVRNILHGPGRVIPIGIEHFKNVGNVKKNLKRSICNNSFFSASNA